MEKSIYIIRHGETEFNRTGMVQGSGVDADLNDTGRLQAQLFFNHYQQHPFEKIFVSSLKRTFQSVEPFIFNKKLPFEIIPELNEISWGHYEGRAYNPSWKQEYFSIIDQWAQGKYDIAVPGGETPLQLQERQKIALNKIINSPEKEILVCMHGRALKSFLCLMLDLPLSKMDDFEHRNLGLYQLKYWRGNFEILEKNAAHHLNVELK